MAANVENMFSVRENVWHDPQGEFTVANYPADWDEARDLAGLNWEPVTTPAFTQTIVAGSDGMPEVTHEPVDNCNLVVRSDDGRVLGHVSPKWVPVQNKVLGEFAEALLDSTDATTRITTAGCIGDGEKVWLLIQLDEPYEMAGDDSLTYPYLVVQNSHDGTGAFQAAPTQIRVVCQNTYDAATLAGERAGNMFKFRHTTNVMERVDEARRAITRVRDDVAQTREITSELASIPASERAYLDFVSLLIPSPAEHGEQITDRVARNIEEARAKLDKVYRGSPTCDANRGTALGLVHAGVEYLDHLRGYRNQTTRLNRTILTPERAKARMVAQAREACIA